LDAVLSVGSGAVSILGLGLVLAALSLANDYTYRRKSGIIQVLKIPNFQFAIDLGLILLELGILGASSVAGIRLLCAVLAVAFGVHAVRTRFTPRGR
jgi:hypothetical protein